MFFRRRRRDDWSVEEQPADGAVYACAFCGDGIVPTRRDPLLLSIVEGFQGGCEVDARPSSSIYAHARCLVDRLGPDMQEHMAEELAE